MALTAPHPQPGRADPAQRLEGLEDHPHARAVLLGALAPGGSPSHAYLFHGPPGTGKRRVARSLAAALLQEGASAPDTVGERVQRDCHPDLSWVRPSGAAEMLVGDIEEAVVGSASRTPFESARRVFVIEGVERMNDQAANRMLKTLEEPASFVHLVLVSDRREDVLATIASRCQQVRFDPLPAGRIAASLGDVAGVDGDGARACARLGLGDAVLARRLAEPGGAALRGSAEGFVRAVIAAETGSRPWLGLLEAARQAGASEGEAAQERIAQELQMLPSRERKRVEREGLDARRRGERRARRDALDLGLRLAELWLRDVLCVREGAAELIYAVDRRKELEQDAEGRAPGALRDGIELVAATRVSLALNVSEELALEALAYRLAPLLAR